MTTMHTCNRAQRLRRIAASARVRGCLALALAAFFLIFAASAGRAQTVKEQSSVSGQVRTEFPYRDGTVTLVSDSQEAIAKTQYHAKGHVVITFQDITV